MPLPHDPLTTRMIPDERRPTSKVSLPRTRFRAAVIAIIKAALWGAVSLAGLYLLALGFRRVDLGWLLLSLLDHFPEYIRHTTG